MFTIRPSRSDRAVEAEPIIWFISSHTALMDRSFSSNSSSGVSVTDLDKVKEEHFPVTHGPVVVVRFNLTIEDVIDSEFMNVVDHAHSGGGDVHTVVQHVGGRGGRGA